MAKTQKPDGFEKFKPISEWKEEPENNILTVHVPDFEKHQTKITCTKASRMVRVHGERKLASNKWSQFNESFPIPENCKIDKIHAKWHEGSLIVYLPKEIITPVAPKEEPKTAKFKGKEVTLVPPNTAQEPLPSKQGAAATSSSAISEKKEDKKSSAIISSRRATPSIQGEKQTDGMRVDGHDALNAHQNYTKQTDHDKTAVQPKFGNLVEHYKEKSGAKKETPSDELKKPENVMDTHTTTLFKEGVVPKTSEKMKEDKGKSKEEGKEKKGMAAGALKAVMEQNEERQLMVNMGVAVLVIVAVGAYMISSSLSSKSKGSSS